MSATVKGRSHLIYIRFANLNFREPPLCEDPRGVDARLGGHDRTTKTTDFGLRGGRRVAVSPRRLQALVAVLLAQSAADPQ